MRRRSIILVRQKMFHLGIWNIITLGKCKSCSIWDNGTQQTRVYEMEGGELSLSYKEIIGLAYFGSSWLIAFNHSIEIPDMDLRMLFKWLKRITISKLQRILNTKISYYIQQTSNTKFSQIKILFNVENFKMGHSKI